MVMVRTYCCSLGCHQAQRRLHLKRFLQLAHLCIGEAFSSSEFAKPAVRSDGQREALFQVTFGPCLTITTILDLYSHTTLYAYYILYTVPWLQLRSNSSISHSAEQHVAELVRPQIQGQVFGDLQRRSQSCADSWVKGGPIYALLHYIIPYYTVRSQITLLGYYIYQIILAKLSARRLVTSCLERTARSGADHYQLKASSRRYVYRYSMGVRMHVYVHIYIYI